MICQPNTNNLGSVDLQQVEQIKDLSPNNSAELVNSAPLPANKFQISLQKQNYQLNENMPSNKNEYIGVVDWPQVQQQQQFVQDDNCESQISPKETEEYVDINVKMKSYHASPLVSNGRIQMPNISLIQQQSHLSNANVRNSIEDENEEEEEQKQGQHNITQASTFQSCISAVRSNIQQQQQQQEEEDSEDIEQLHNESLGLEERVNLQTLKEKQIDFVEERIVNKEILHENTYEDIKCPVCYNICRDVTQCKHCNKNFCYYCIQDLTACPCCRTRFRTRLQYDNSHLRDRFVISCENEQVKKHEVSCEYQIVECVNKHLGCDRMGIKKLVLQHQEKKCKFRYVHCANFSKGCGCIMPYSVKREHEKNQCNYRDYECPNELCTWIGLANTYLVHTYVCQMVYVDCDHKQEGCSWSGQRRHLHDHKVHDCHFAKFLCQICNVIFPYSQFQEHEFSLCQPIAQTQQSIFAMNKARYIVKKLLDEHDNKQKEIDKIGHEHENLQSQYQNVLKLQHDHIEQNKRQSMQHRELYQSISEERQKRESEIMIEIKKQKQSYEEQINEIQELKNIKLQQIQKQNEEQLYQQKLEIEKQTNEIQNLNQQRQETQDKLLETENKKFQLEKQNQQKDQTIIQLQEEGLEKQKFKISSKRLKIVSIFLLLIVIALIFIYIFA